MNYKIINDGIVKIIETSLDCEKKDCINYGGLGCHGADDPMNQTCCKLDLKDATKCLNSKPTYLYKDVRRNRE